LSASPYGAASQKIVIFRAKNILNANFTDQNWKWCSARPVRDEVCVLYLGIPKSRKIIGFNLLAPELFFLNFGTTCI
jgi:hypothetical protein